MCNGIHSQISKASNLSSMTTSCPASPNMFFSKPFRQWQEKLFASVYKEIHRNAWNFMEHHGTRKLDFDPALCSYQLV